MNLPRIRTALLAACTAALLVPAAAQAATLTNEGGTLVYRGEGSEGLSLLLTSYSPWGSNETYLTFSDWGADRIQINGAPCHIDPDDAARALCSFLPVRVEGSAANDSLSIFSADDVPDSLPVELHGGGGDDQIKDAYDALAGRTLTGGPGNDKIEGFAGGDSIDGGDGNDVVDGGEGDDQVRGGAGDDEMWGDHYKAPGADLLDGGPGVDTTQEWSIPSDLDRQPVIDVTLDGQANDGRPGEGDNVVGIERLDMYVVGSFSGSEGPDQIKIVNPGNDGGSTLTGNGGDDVLVGNDFNDTVDGGAGADTVEGGLGNDTVTGGPGPDTIYGDATSAHCGWYSCKVPFGNDVINARDGAVDNIDCGIGQDKAIVDAHDVVANCETVEGGGPVVEGPKDGGPKGGVAFGVAGKLSVRAVAAKGLKVSVACPAACTVSGALHVDKGTARKLRLGSTKVGSGRRTALEAGTATATLKLTAKARRAFKKLRRARLTVKVTVKPAGAPAVTGSRTVALKR